MRLSLGLVFVVSAACGPPPDPILTCDTTAPVTLKGAVQMQVFDVNCKSCHNATATYGDYSNAEMTFVNTVNKSSAVAPRTPGSALKNVDPNVLANSSLWLKLNGATMKYKGPKGEDVGGVMPPAGVLTAAQVKVVKDWICSGAKLE